ncbi:SusC/RagA family TonB-linked outer membrane protein [Dysgonomonas sp. ZJ279]|uniref:SusC/RagA family TonB-linked outer membrane protein n=1 Tax=Dysgonomonas sp. ZJ279 TaxID=2709796 RepID=UPI0013EBCB64|nr:TonB-dependent receptor [Dysgonomonas sp. ZJ279]
MKNKDLYLLLKGFRDTHFPNLLAIKLTIVLLFAVSLTTYAEDNHTQATQQQRIITGNVKDNSGEVLTGVSVVEKGTTNGTVTDIDGNYSIRISGERATLVFSFIGYSTREIPLGPQSTVDVSLVEDTRLLDEVIVVSYGTQKKRDVTGAISKVDGSTLRDFPVGQVAQKLQGQVAGVQINQVSGQPGQGMTIRIRGAASVNSGNEPLYVVDGMPITSGINNINPDEIESFSILKDASATSLYGSRAANGVVLITTKRGKAGKTDVSFNASYGIQTLRGLKKPDVMNGQEYAQYKKEFYEDKAKYEGYTGGVPTEYQNPSIYGEGTNWYDELTRDATVQNYSLSVTTGKDKFNAAVFLGYFNQDGVMINTGFQRASLRANIDYQVNPRLKLGLNIAPTFVIGNNQGVDGHRNILGAAIEAPPIVGPYDENGNLRESINAPGAFNQVNWVRKMQERTDKNKTFTVLNNFFAELDIWDGIKYKLQAGADISSNNRRVFNPSTSAGNWNSTPPWKASGEYHTGFNYNWTVENMLTYDKTFSEKHKLNLLAGYSAQKSTWEGSSLYGSDYPDDEIPWIDGAATKGGSKNTNSTNSWALASMIGRVNYSFMDRYLLQATIRRDGCSRFGSGNKYANFPSISAGWIVSDESFMEPLTRTMNYLKLRASYGITGNYNIGNYNHIAELENKNYVFDDALVSGQALKRIGNNKLTWEENKQFDIGVDFGFLNDRIYVMYDYYHKRTDGMLYQIDIPTSTGFSKIDSNVGDFKSWGHEFTVISRNIDGVFKWTTNFNLSINKNKILKLGTNNTPIGAYGKDSDFNRLQVGQPIGVFVGFIYDGVYMTQEDFNNSPKYATSDVGTAKMRDIDGDGEITFEGDRTIIGDPNPDFIYGITNEFYYKNFDLSILISGQVGGDVMNANYEDTENLDGVFNVRKYVADRWRSLENPGNGLVPRTKSGTTELYRFANSHWVSDASYLAIKNVTLGYTFQFKPNDYISKARVFLTAQQLAVFTKYKGLNPEIGIYDSGSATRSWQGLGIDRTTYPVPRIFSIGCNITF